ncbi:hypothetical protein RRG08_014189 [Elysia crispata]|uniref:Uncharacterized protein n=1 Tax=Elysia crispata TaxID=231223 RepID=A0AAE0Z309_9GAST|nr:hypothetical protein RRG08_014189 [Elysia crispata]
MVQQANLRMATQCPEYQDYRDNIQTTCCLTIRPWTSRAQCTSPLVTYWSAQAEVRKHHRNGHLVLPSFIQSRRTKEPTSNLCTTNPSYRAS